MFDAYPEKKKVNSERDRMNAGYSVYKHRKNLRRRAEKDQILHHLTRMSLVSVLSSHFIILIRILW